MFSNRLQRIFSEKADINGYMSQTKLEEVLRDGLGYTFNRHFIKELETPYINSEGGETSLLTIGGSNIKVEGKRTKYSINACIDILCYLLVTDSISGMFRGNVKEERLKVLAIAKLLGTRFVVSLRQLAYSADVQQGNYPDVAGWAPDDYDPCVHGQYPLDLQRRLNLTYHFLYHWLNGDNSKEYDFYRDWRLFRDRVLCEDPLAVESKELCDDKKIHKMLPFKDTDKFTIPFLNKYQMRRAWKSTQLLPIGNVIDKHGATLGTSITILDSFIKTSDRDSVEKLRDWFEIILVYNNDSNWIVDEAKACLKKDISLDQEGLISDWWLLAFIYLSTIEKYLQKD